MSKGTQLSVDELTILDETEPKKRTSGRQRSDARATSIRIRGAKTADRDLSTPARDTLNLAGLPVKRDAVSLTLPKKISFEKWLNVGAALSKVEQSLPWWRGDWWVHADDRYGQRRYQVQSWDWHVHPHTLENYASVCRKFKGSRRRERLTFGHHEAVAGLPPEEADELLDWAESARATQGRPYSVRDLREEVQRRRAVKAPLSAGTTPETNRIPIRVTSSAGVATRIKLIPVIPEHSPSAPTNLSMAKVMSTRDMKADAIRRAEQQLLYLVTRFSSDFDYISAVLRPVLELLRAARDKIGEISHEYSVPTKDE
jgi:hypothetical protein